MAYTLEQFCGDCTALLKNSPKVEAALPKIAEKLKQLLVNRDFIAATFQDDTPPGKRALYHDPDTDYYVMAHVQEAGKAGSPHSHGASWAIYGNINGATRMREYARANPESEEGAILKKSAEYDLRRGDTKAYGPGFIHSTEHPEACWVIRVTGTDLDQIERFRFRKLKDQVLEEA